MGTLNDKLQLISDETSEMRSSMLRLRQLQRAAERLGLNELSRELEEIANEIVDALKTVDSAISVVVSEFIHEVKAQREPVEDDIVTADAD